MPEVLAVTDGVATAMVADAVDDIVVVVAATAAATIVDDVVAAAVFLIPANMAWPE